VLRTQQVAVRELDEGTQVTTPVTVRGDVMGAMDLMLTTRPTTQQVAEIAGIGHLLGHIVVVNRRYTDLFEWGQRTTALSLSAEIQRRLLPSAFTCEAGQCTLAGWLEPASTVGGDTFDYAFDRGTLHLSITDAAVTTWKRQCLPRSSSARFEMPDVPEWTFARRPSAPTTSWRRTHPSAGSSRAKSYG
jgi:hypothetical protein